MPWTDRVNWEAVRAASEAHDVHPALIAAIGQKESGWDTWALRYEPGWRYEFLVREMACQFRTTEETQRHLQRFSYGITQLLGTVALELGYRDHLIKLCIFPSVNVGLGAKKLASLYDRYSKLEDVISAYNMGSCVKDLRGERRNQKSYVDPVLKFIDDVNKTGV